MANNHIFDEEVGLLKRGSIVSYDENTGMMKVRFSGASSIRGPQSLPINVPAPHAMFYNNGMFMGTLPVPGTPVIIAQGSGGQYHFVSFLAENISNVPTLTSGELLIQSNDETKITLNSNDDIYIGSDNNRIHIDTTSNLITTNFFNSNEFTQASRKVNGLVKRDLLLNTNYDQSLKLENDSYDEKFYTIGLDPTISPNSSTNNSNKNPPFVEEREMIYEFQYNANVSDDLTESSIYGSNPIKKSVSVYPNRRQSRADTLSLTLLSPNYLMENVKGTVIDIFGNILDINRYPLPIGQGQNTLNATISTDKVISFNMIKALERNSLAYHFELNARKDLSGSNGQVILPDINSNADYARNRSRLFLDITKEGVFKLNIPCSSENGIVPLLTRYENYSSFGQDQNGNVDPNQLVFRDDNIDIYQDSFAAPSLNVQTGAIGSVGDGSVSVMDNDGYGTPVDRITGNNIKWGTAYHDISSTCYAAQRSDFIQFVADPQNVVFSKSAVQSIPLLNTIVSPTINSGLSLSGTGTTNTSGASAANAGGRSGLISIDGSLDFNIGANTSDRQSIIFDTAGGIVGNIGRDLRNNSALLKFDGNTYLQFGSIGVSTDSRFQPTNTKNPVSNGQIGAVLDIRVMSSGGYCTLLRFDDHGIKILTPGQVAIHSAQGTLLTSDGDIDIECENLVLQGRLVQKETGGSI
jgi:hypothetical protein